MAEPYGNDGIELTEPLNSSTSYQPPINKKPRYGRHQLLNASITIGIIAILFVALVTYFVKNEGHATKTLKPTPSPTQCVTTPSDLIGRVDCHPEPNVNQETCIKRGCVYDPCDVTVSGAAKCYRNGTSNGYKVVPSLDLVDSNTTVRLEKVDSISLFSTPIMQVALTHEFLGDNILHFKFTDASTSRYEVPIADHLWKSQPQPAPQTTSTMLTFSLSATEDGSFNIIIKRSATNKALWDLGLGGFVFENQFLQLITKLPSENMYGFGENVHQSLKHDFSEVKTWPLFARDEPTWSDQETRNNHYGVHPFYLCVEDNKGNAYGVVLINSNAQEYTTMPGPALGYRTIGGIFDFYLFAGPTPNDVIQQYLSLIGYPKLPPYWALGFQLCRYGYNNMSDVNDALQRTLNNNIPIDVQYIDIDYMDRFRDFTYDTEAFGQLPNFIDHIHSLGMRMILILDPAIEVSHVNYAALEDGLSDKVFIAWPPGSNQSYIDWINDDYPTVNGTTYMLGTVWPDNNTAFPDWFKNDTQIWWQHQIYEFHQKIPLDGVWIDMNEPANFGTNDNHPWYFDSPGKPKAPSLHCPRSEYDDPPYQTWAVYFYDEYSRLSNKTLCMVGQHGVNMAYRHYDTHNLFGWGESIATLAGIENAIAERSVVISRSTFPTSGQFVGHWLGDNNQRWSDIRTSLIGIMEFNMFGIPYVGADICGFNEGAFSPELCLRWMQVGAFYTFCRNHNTINAPPHDPGSLGPLVANASRVALELRYRLLPHLYTLFFRAHMYGETVVRPMFFAFPADPTALTIDKQFMWGFSLLVSPVLQEGETEVEAYFPKGYWYSIRNGNDYGNRTIGPTKATIAAPTTTMIPVHIRGGTIFPCQEPAINTYYSRQKPFELLIALDENQSASGDFYWDNGTNLAIPGDEYFYGQMVLTSGNGVHSLIIQNVQNQPQKLKMPSIGSVEVFGLPQQPQITSFMLNNQALANDRNATIEYQDMWLKISILTPNPMEWKTGTVLQWSDAGSVVTHSSTPGTTQCVTSPSDLIGRVDCHPEPNVNQETCIKRGCVYDPCDVTVSGAAKCYRNGTSNGYKVVPSLDLVDSDTTVRLEKMDSISLFSTPIMQVALTHEFLGDNILHFKFTDVSTSRYEVPIADHLWKSQPQPAPQTTSTMLTFSLSATEDGSFNIIIKRSATNKALWDLGLGGFVFENQFLQLITKLPSENMYGFGENVHQSLKHDFSEVKTWPLFARDEPTWSDQETRNNHYGVHPFYLCVEDNKGNAYGVVLINSNAQEYTTMPGPALGYRTIGGIFDFYLFAGPTPNDVIQQYLSLIGYPKLPPYWALGFQLCRYGYNNMSDVNDALQRTLNNNIPIDVQYIDIDYMDRFRDFTYDTEAFGQLPNFIDHIHSLGMRMILILDPAIEVSHVNYAALEDGLSDKVFIAWPPGSNQSYIDWINDDYPTVNGTTYMLGTVWPDNNTAFPDWFKNDTQIWWQHQIYEFHQKIPLDGVWIDMNEPANFGTNDNHPWYFDSPGKPKAPSLHCPRSEYDDPPYQTWAVYFYDEYSRLSNKTLCMVGQHGVNMAYRHYDTHNLFGWGESIATLAGIENAIAERSVVISRSTFPTSGQFVGHWLGDNNQRWSDIRTSLIGIMEFNMFGIPYVGADICGFNEGAFSPELCLRWMQVGAFYTFCRNHNTINAPPHDPGSLGPLVANASRVALELRYRLLPHLYTLFFRAHMYGETVVRPMFFAFPADPTALTIDKQFMWGFSLLVTPVLQEGETEVEAYFPIGYWYSIRNGNDYGNRTIGPTKATIAAPTTTMIPVHIRGGTIFPCQEPAINTYYSRQKPFELLIALDENQSASGDFYWDNGTNLAIPGDDYFYGQIGFNSTVNGVHSLIIQNVQNQPQKLSMSSIGSVEVFGLPKQPNVTSFMLNNQTLDDRNVTIEFHDTWLKISIFTPNAMEWKAGTILEWSDA